MTTEATEIATEIRPAVDKAMAGRRTLDSRISEKEHLSPGNSPEPTEKRTDFTLAPLVDKIAYGMASGLLEAVRELEQYIGSETRKVADMIERRLDALQVSMDALANFATEQRAINSAVQDQLEQLKNDNARLREADIRQVDDLTALRNQTGEVSATLMQKIDGSTASLTETDARQMAELEALRSETRASAKAATERVDTVIESGARQSAELAALQSETKALSQSIAERIETVCREIGVHQKELGVHQEDIGASKTSLGTLYARFDTLVERLDRQAEAVRSMHTAYSQRENELEQVVDSLARLRAFPTSLPSNAL